MPLSVQFRWSSPQVQVSSAPQESMERGLQGLASGIGRAVQKTYEKGLQERRNRIEDEDRRRRIRIEDEDRSRRNRLEDQDRSRRIRIENEDRSRRMAEEDRKKGIYGEAAGLMRNNSTLATLEAQRATILDKISKLEKELGIDG